MLQLNINSQEFFNEKTSEFMEIKQQSIKLEHSLVSISKWESKYHKPFLSKENKTLEELQYYVKCMTLTPNVDDNLYLALSKENWNEINNYMDDSMTATWFKGNDNYGNREVITSELIYYWMIACEIPFECQKWHINRLFTLIRICNIKNAPSKKMSKRDIMSKNTALNAARRAKMNSRG